MAQRVRILVVLAEDQDHTQGLQPSLTPVPGDPVPPLILMGTRNTCAHTNRQAELSLLIKLIKNKVIGFALENLIPTHERRQKINNLISVARPDNTSHQWGTKKMEHPETRRVQAMSEEHKSEGERAVRWFISNLKECAHSLPTSRSPCCASVCI